MTSKNTNIFDSRNRVLLHLVLRLARPFLKMASSERVPRRRQTIASPRMFASPRMYATGREATAAATSRGIAGTSRPAFPSLRPITSDHIDTVVLDEHEHHHPHEDEHIEEEEEHEQESQSDRTLREEGTPDSTQQRSPTDPEKAEKRPARPRAKSSGGKPPDPETRDWKDDVGLLQDFQLAQRNSATEDVELIRLYHSRRL